MLNAKLRSQYKTVPIRDGLLVEDHLIDSSGGTKNVKIALRTYIPDQNDGGLPAML